MYTFTSSGVLDVIEKYASKDAALRSALTKEMKIFRNGEGDFGSSSAINDRSGMLASNLLYLHCCSYFFSLFQLH